MMQVFNELLYLVFQLIMLFVAFNGIKNIWFEWVRPYFGYTKYDIPWIDAEIEALQNLRNEIENANSED